MKKKRKGRDTGMAAIVVVLYIYPDQHHKHESYLLNFMNFKKNKVIFSKTSSPMQNPPKINFPD